MRRRAQTSHTISISCYFAANLHFKALSSSPGISKVCAPYPGFASLMLGRVKQQGGRRR